MPRRVSAAQYVEHHEQLIDETIPMEDRFDWQATESLLTYGNRNHKAYGMTLDEYSERRGDFMDRDDHEKQRLSCYIPSFYAQLSVDLAARMRISTTRFMILILEMGIITFKVDYHDAYEIIKVGRGKIMDSITDKKTEHLYTQITKQTISMGSADGARVGMSKHFTPSVPSWLHTIVVNDAAYLNMSISDLVYASWCIGMVASLPENLKRPYINTRIMESITYFNMEINMLSEQIKWLKLKNSDNTSISCGTI